MESFNSRELAKKLKCSTQPIFWKYKTMDELKKVVYKKVEELYSRHILNGMSNNNSFLAMGMAYIDFAKKEKNLFKLLFMSNSIKVKNVFEMIGSEEDHEIIKIISQMTSLSEENSKQLYINIWLVTHGIASMEATNTCIFTDSEIEDILTDSFMGFSRQFKYKETEKDG